MYLLLVLKVEKGDTEKGCFIIGFYKFNIQFVKGKKECTIGN